MNTVNHDNEYLKRDDIGKVIAEGLAEVYRSKPQNPIDHFAKWLLNESSNRKAEKRQVLENEKAAELVKRAEEDAARKAKLEEERKRAKEALDYRIQLFRDKIKASSDPAEELQALVDHLHEFTGATSVYLGKIVKPINTDLAEDADDQAHEIAGAPDQIEWAHASKGSEFLVEKVLTQEEGITFDLLREDPNEIVQEENLRPESEDGLPRHLIVAEVVRNEERMHFYKVPRLGSYLAIKLEYDSCLNEEGFDAAVANYTAVNTQTRETAEEKEKFEDDQEDLRLEKEEAGEPFVAEEREWPEFEYSEFVTKKVQYVVGLNTLGQDRQFSEDEINFALTCIKAYQDAWEEAERVNLDADVRYKVEMAEFDKYYREHYEAQDNAEIEALVDVAIQDAATEKMAEGEEEMDDDERELVSKKTRWEAYKRMFWAPGALAEYNTKMERAGNVSVNAPSAQDQRVASAMSSIAGTSAKKSQMSNKNDESEILNIPKWAALVPECWKERMVEYSKLRVVKYLRILQTATYLLKFQEKEAVCEKYTNKLSWNLIKVFFELKNDQSIYAAIAKYEPFGPKADEYKEYQKLCYLQDNLAGITQEELDEYSAALGRLFKWLSFALELRIEDVKMRRMKKKRDRDYREECEEKENDRVEKRQQDLEKAREDFDAALQAQMEAENEGEEEFDEADYIAKFDDQNPPVDIPPEVESDVDNDYDLPSDEEPEVPEQAE